MGEYKDINFKKKFGQNFLSDKNLLASIVLDAGVNSDDIVVEIGAGAGALTEFLVKSCKKVIAFEIDKELEPVLTEKFKGYNNIQIIYEDFLNIDEEKFLELVGEDFKVVANLPYYITSPIITKLFELKHRPKTISVMVQKEVGERMIADNKSSDYGYFSVYVQANADAKITRNVNRKMFTPVPNVDSCIVRLDVKDNCYEKEFFGFLKHCFAMKRKTIKNNISSVYSISKEKIDNILKDLGFSESVRADSLTKEQLYEIYKKIS